MTKFTKKREFHVLMEENKKKIYKSDSLHVVMLLTEFDKKIKETPILSRMDKASSLV